MRLANFQFQHVRAAALRAVHEQLGDRIARFLLSGSRWEFENFGAIERVLEENRISSGSRRLFHRQRGGRRWSLYHRRGHRLRLGGQMRYAT